LVLQTTPLAVIALPPSLVILPPPVAVVLVIKLIGTEVIIGIVLDGMFGVVLSLSLEQPNKKNM